MTVQLIGVSYEIQRINDIKKTSFEDKRLMLQQLNERAAEIEQSIKERKSLNKICKKEQVKRSILLKIFAAQMITVPASALSAAFIGFAIPGMMAN